MSCSVSDDAIQSIGSSLGPGFPLNVGDAWSGGALWTVARKHVRSTLHISVWKLSLSAYQGLTYGSYRRYTIIINQDARASDINYNPTIAHHWNKGLSKKTRLSLLMHDLILMEIIETPITYRTQSTCVNDGEILKPCVVSTCHRQVSTDQRRSSPQSLQNVENMAPAYRSYDQNSSVIVRNAFFHLELASSVIRSFLDTGNQLIGCNDDPFLILD